MNQAVINAVKPIVTSRVEKPIIVLETNRGTIIRSPKQFFTDLQNSGRLLNVPETAFDRGYENAFPQHQEALKRECFRLAGKTVQGDWTFYKAGDNYTPDENHPCFTNPNHEMFNKVKLGEPLKATNDGCWVTGFLSIPKTDMEYAMEDTVQVAGNALAQMFAGFGVMPTQQAIPANTDNVFDVEETPDTLTTEAVGAGKGKTGK
jgi:hypothetical protein